VLDVHRRRSPNAVVDQEGTVLVNRNVPNRADTVLSAVGGLPTGTPVTFEAAHGWGWPVELLDAYGFEPHTTRAAPQGDRLGEAEESQPRPGARPTRPAGRRRAGRVRAAQPAGRRDRVHPVSVGVGGFGVPAGIANQVVSKASFRQKLPQLPLAMHPDGVRVTSDGVVVSVSGPAAQTQPNGHGPSTAKSLRTC
jgi:hypothetical protein